MIPGIELKIGSSPFVLLRDVIEDPVFVSNPNFVPDDGRGLNPLLQNYWMVIHPPVLFLGFAATLIRFHFALPDCGIKIHGVDQTLHCRGDCSQALCWALAFLMGGYWAYETLSFGGYWNWGPVENAVYVPWLIWLQLSTWWCSTKQPKADENLDGVGRVSFILILYSTFLTRSGILGDASVHSFTDLGLSGQLLIYLLVFTLGAIALMMARWKHIPPPKRSAATWSKEFWIFMGIATLCLMGFQVFAAHIIPCIEQILGLFGINSTMATPANQIEFYSRLQLWFCCGCGDSISACAILLVEAHWRHHMEKRNSVACAVLFIDGLHSHQHISHVQFFFWRVDVCRSLHHLEQRNRAGFHH